MSEKFCSAASLASIGVFAGGSARRGFNQKTNMKNLSPGSEGAF
jgi:hypothetical protein